MDGSLTTRLPSGGFSAESPENSSQWPWTNGPTDSTLHDQHHMEFISYGSAVGFSVYLTLVGFVAIVGNILAIAVCITEKEFRKKEHNILVLNMAIADLIVSILGYPSSTISGYAGRWVFGDAGCTIYGFICFTCALCTMVTLVAISVYRYIVICKPQYAHLLTHRRTMYVILGSWLYVLLFSVPPLVGVNRYTYEPSRITCSLDWNVQYPGETAFIGLTITFCYVLNVSIMVFCYCNILLKSSSLKFAALASATAKKVVKNDIRKASLMCMAMVVSYLVVWTPYAVSASWNILSEDELPVMATVLPSMFAKASCMMNPIIYSYCNSTFRKSALKFLRRVGFWRNQTEPLYTAREMVRKRRSTVQPAAENFAMNAVAPSTAQAGTS